ncbi:chemotaxis protein CheW [Pseudomonas sp. 10B1]|uniref:CheW domain-containing protein n=1 Tax=unclassified Pseudomonas TaxID=196821 RepID=UPI002AB5DD68|nr:MULTISPECIES: CheW domain-containing protein [unclassified Pseudomonas]MDY7560716.1 CheW domain-containing protein [Pseudomonas sp. AB6]MEA9979553.1 chemotaxis protein CheW [Pseudomonas sp. RTS4]MEA9996046.1 chemotaxis protein CheW [Pseudomonas sp. AA4]MEB0087369.1 chemotaxis protein CheW [Pseudomonas sp. RTI1]MEB0127941.1 chemotaxis protein CheW [Pseudomonas sp. CCC1.2]
MNRPVDIATRPQLALQSYLDALLQDATEELTVSSGLDEFQAAVLEEQARDAVVSAALAAVVVAVPVPSVVHEVALPAPVALVPKVIEAKPVVERSVTMFNSAVDVSLPSGHGTPPALAKDDRPAWAAEPFECLLFDVAGLTLAVPLVCLGSIYSLAGAELTPLFGQPDWFLGILPSQSGNLKVLDTARWVMPDRYRDDFRQGLQYVISVQGYEWGLAVHHVSRSIRLDPNEIKWRSQRGQRPWLAGTVIEHMCALLDVSELAELIASGAVKQMGVIK